MSRRKRIKRRGTNRGEHTDGRVPPVDTGHDRRSRERRGGDIGSPHGADAPDGISGGWG